MCVCVCVCVCGVKIALGMFRPMLVMQHGTHCVDSAVRRQRGRANPASGCRLEVRDERREGPGAWEPQPGLPQLINSVIKVQSRVDPLGPGWLTETEIYAWASEVEPEPQ